MLAAVPTTPLPWHAVPVLIPSLAAALVHAHRMGWLLKGDVGAAMCRAHSGGRLPLLHTLEQLLQDAGVVAAAPLRVAPRGGSPEEGTQRRKMSRGAVLSASRAVEGDVGVVGQSEALGFQAGPQGGPAPGILLWSRPGHLKGPSMVLHALLCTLHSASVHMLSLAAIVAAGDGDLTSGLVQLMQSVRQRYVASGTSPPMG